MQLLQLRQRVVLLSLRSQEAGTPDWVTPSRISRLLLGPVFNRKETNGDGEMPGAKKSGNDANSAWNPPCCKDLPCSLWISRPRDLDAGPQLP